MCSAEDKSQNDDYPYAQEKHLQTPPSATFWGRLVREIDRDTREDSNGGELVQNVGMNKFVPAIRQKPGSAKKPKFLASKMHIDLSRDEEVSANIEDFARLLQKVPKNPKPKLRPNPWESAPKESIDIPSQLTALPLSGIPEIPLTALQTYQAAAELARTGDRIRWRKMVQAAISAFPSNLAAWRSNPNPVFGDTPKAISLWALGALESASSLFAIALAGVESGDEYFSSQLGLIEELRNPNGWDGNGPTVIVNMPDLFVFVYQALMGALSLATRQAQLAQQLATVELQNRYTGESHRLFEYSEFIGWPDSLGHRVNIAWTFLLDLPKSWTWLDDVFGPIEFYHSALAAYYEFLNIIEFLDAIAHEIDLAKPGTYVLVPASYAAFPEGIQRRSENLLRENETAIANIWHKAISGTDVTGQWSQWTALTSAWVREVHTWVSRVPLPHDRFVKGLMTLPESRTVNS